MPTEQPAPTMTALVEAVDWLTKNVAGREAAVQRDARRRRAEDFNIDDERRWATIPSMSLAHASAVLSALTPPTDKPCDDALRAKVLNWRGNLGITRACPIAGDVLHGPALDFVIEQLDDILGRAALKGTR